MTSVRNASLDPFGNNYFGQEQADMFGNNFDANVVHINVVQLVEHWLFQCQSEYQNGEYDEYMAKQKQDFNSLNEKCQYLEDCVNRTRQTAEMWKMRFETEQQEKNQLLNERNNLLAHIDHMKAQIMPMQFMQSVQLSSPLSINLPQENYDGGIRPSASLQHSPPYNIFGVWYP